MEHKIGDTTYKMSFGFGNVLEIQRMMSEAFAGDDMSQFDGMTHEELESLTMADVGNTEAMLKSIEMMPKAVAQVLRGVNGEEIDDPATYVRDELEIEHGMELFNLIAEQTRRLTPKKQE